MEPFRHFQFCPKCGQRRDESPSAALFQCGSCGFAYYFNPAIAAAAIVLGPDVRALFIRRAKDPAKGKLAMPGGFIDIGETAEEGLRREVREEVNLELTSLRYLCSQLNSYPYRGVTYPVLDLFFVGHVITPGAVTALDGVENFCWLEPAKVDPAEIAFPSMRKALTIYASLPGSGRDARCYAFPD
jgi:ADP-ribose pyrophosphatase YjhB (NUDIX family)